MLSTELLLNNAFLCTATATKLFLIVLVTIEIELKSLIGHFGLAKTKQSLFMLLLKFLEDFWGYFRHNSSTPINGTLHILLKICMACSHATQNNCVFDYPNMKIIIYIIFGSL
jgi:hypothetical protein